MDIAEYTTLCSAIVLLMKPLVEIVIHDLESATICYIEGGISKRNVSDPSLLDVNTLEAGIDKIVYPKLSFDGRLVKSISVPLADKWLICINCDVSIFDQMQHLSAQFLHHSDLVKPQSLFKNDWQEHLHVAIHQYLKEQSWQFQTLTGTQKKALLNHLFMLGAFSEKNASDYLANTLDMGRATIFKYLKEWRTQDNEHF